MDEKFALRVLNSALHITGAEQGNIQAIDRKTGVLEIVAHRGFSEEFVQSFRQVRSVDDCVCGRAMLLREPVVVEDVMSDPRFPSLRSTAQREGFISVQSTPMITSNGELVGMISTHGERAPTRPKIEELKLLALQTVNELIGPVRETKRCNGCGGTKLYVTKVLDPTTWKTFEVTRCVGCDHVRWAELKAET